MASPQTQIQSNIFASWDVFKRITNDEWFHKHCTIYSKALSENSVIKKSTNSLFWQICIHVWRMVSAVTFHWSNKMSQLFLLSHFCGSSITTHQFCLLPFDDCTSRSKHCLWCQIWQGSVGSNIVLKCYMEMTQFTSFNVYFGTTRTCDLLATSLCTLSVQHFRFA